MVLRDGLGVLGREDRRPALRKRHGTQADAADDNAGQEPDHAIGLGARLNEHEILHGVHNFIESALRCVVNHNSDEDNDEANDHSDVLEVRRHGHALEPGPGHEQENQDGRGHHAQRAGGLIAGGKGDHGSQADDLYLHDGDEEDHGNNRDGLGQNLAAELVTHHVRVGVIVKYASQLPDNGPDEEHTDVSEHQVCGKVGGRDPAEDRKSRHAEEGKAGEDRSSLEEEGGDGAHPAVTDGPAGVGIKAAAAAHEAEDGDEDDP